VACCESAAHCVPSPAFCNTPAHQVTLELHMLSKLMYGTLLNQKCASASSSHVVTVGKDI
jgi:hypothetical protein